MDLRLVFKIPDSELTINGLIQGLKEGSPEIYGAILSTLMKALEERFIEQMLQQAPGRYHRQGHQSKPRKLKSSLGTVSYRFAQLRDQQEGRSLIPLAEALSIPAYDHYLEETMEPSLGLSIHVSYRRATREVKKPEQLPLVKRLKSIPAMNLTKSQLEQLRPEDRPQVEEIAHRTQQGFKNLLNALDPEKYPKARTYIQNLIHPVTTFFSWWLNRGEVIPLNTNAIETAFSQVCNRIKKVGKRWSDKGLLNWLKVAFYKIFKPERWPSLWPNQENQLPKIELVSVKASCFWSGGIT